MHDTGTYTHEFLCSDLVQKNVVPSKARVNARSVADFPDWVRHEGDDFLLVLEGTIELHTEFYEPVRLETGDSAYFDARMGHLCISVSEADALVLWVPTHSGPAPAFHAGAGKVRHRTCGIGNRGPTAAAARSPASRCASSGATCNRCA